MYVPARRRIDVGIFERLTRHAFPFSAKIDQAGFQCTGSLSSVLAMVAFSHGPETPASGWNCHDDLTFWGFLKSDDESTAFTRGRSQSISLKVSMSRRVSAGISLRELQPDSLKNGRRGSDPMASRVFFRHGSVSSICLAMSFAVCFNALTHSVNNHGFGGRRTRPRNAIASQS